MRRRIPSDRAPPLHRQEIAALLPVAAVTLLLACGVPSASARAAEVLEEIYVLRSIREPHAPTAGWCDPERTGFEPFAQDAERLFSFWSIRTRPEDGKVVDAKAEHVAGLRACFGPTEARARQNFYAEINLGAISFRGHGECFALKVDFPEPSVFPVRCQLVLDGMPPPYVGGLLTTNTLTTNARFGGESEPPGYTQASIATIRLWRARVVE